MAWILLLVAEALILCSVLPEAKGKVRVIFATEMSTNCLLFGLMAKMVVLNLAPASECFA